MQETSKPIKKTLLHRFLDAPLIFGVVFTVIYFLTRYWLSAALSFWVPQTNIQDGLYDVCCTIPNIILMALLAKYLIRWATSDASWKNGNIPVAGMNFTLGFTGKRLGSSLVLSIPLVMTKAFFLIIVVALVITGNAAITSNIVLYALLACIVPGLSEELLVRGVVLGNMVRCYGADTKGIFKSAVLSSAVFGATHIVNYIAGIPLPYVITQMFFATGVGFLCAAMYLRTRNIWGCVIGHALFDGISLIMSGVIAGQSLTAKESMEATSTITANSLVSLTAYTVILVAIGLFLLRKSKREDIKKLWED